ncbi:TPA: acyltransferase family protein [Yersinia enterocolitica]|uniref:acyltransferase family protein n=1 Tax=Yersinia enterocolitica TaxID=630 RepID=UPI0005E852D1|nr:acyltransferase [Yersinia enterocolitica]CNL16418.1 acyltransferase family protein [Yersinia frederiksenii]HDL7964630.1 acyltransferase [Yersinia enterocolitica]HDM8436278.1 acyltransferase [Yersinia enterocolitica]HEN3491784.1 acyltransferase [Yersinia enterocolitica]
MDYRTDIDGLRGLAVLAVLLFHAGFGVSGGFIGVDVFFVISGFLITGILVNSIEKNRFNVIEFYKRRIVRLYPALCITLLLTLFVGFLIFDTQQLTYLAKSAVWAAASASNIYFSKGSGYFSLGTDLKPLLHTWSLGVEQQFYLIWPLVIFWGIRKGKNALIKALVVITIVSLCLSQYAVLQGKSGSYFYTQMRVFELALGGILVFIPKRKTSAVIDDILCVIGISLIITSAFLFNRTTLFPGVNALLPCLGALLCLYSGKAKYSGLLLRNKIIVFIGMISYSLYLVHWPVIVFYKYYIFVKPTLIDQFAMIAISIMLAIPMYYLCEHVCQNINKQRASSTKPLVLALASILIIITGSRLIVSNMGLPWRLDEKYQGLVLDSPFFHENYYGGAGYELDQVLGDAANKVVLAGDSYAMQLLHGMERFLSDKIEVQGDFSHGCFFSEEVASAKDGKPGKECMETYSRMLSLLDDNDKPLILAQAWITYEKELIKKTGEKVNFSDKEEYYSFIYDNLSDIRARIGNGRKMIIIGNPPVNENHPGFAVSQCLFRPIYMKYNCANTLNFNIKESPTNEINKKLLYFATNNKNTYFIDPAAALCSDGQCSDVIDGKMIFSDTGHLSKDGSDIFIEKFKNEIIKIIN